MLRLAKLLELTASSHDGEALAAVRKANQERERLELTWTELLVGQSSSLQQPSDATPPAPPTQPPSRQRKPPRTACWTAPDGNTWEAVFRVIYDHVSLSDDWAKTIGSIETYHTDRGYLTRKQADLVLKFFATAQERMAA